MDTSRDHDNTPVLIVGGSLVGLSAAVFLAWHRVPTVLVERHTGSSVHPRAIGYTTRTLELFRSVGIEVPRSVERGGPPRRARVESLAGAWHEEYPWTPHAQGGSPDDFSPVHGTAIAQDRLESLLRARAIELGADLRLGTKLIAFDQDDDGVTAVLNRGDDGSQYRMRADYLVAADGGSSTIRNTLGIGRGGRGLLSVQRSILFRAPLQDYLRHGVVQFEIDHADLKAFLTPYSDGRWVLMLGDDTERTEDEQRAVVRQAVGRSNVPIDLITTGRWELAAAIADQFSYGRAFLAGDAAHQLPPNRGGYGANTGIEDAHNLSWKLAAVLGGTSRPELLDTYDSERRPIAWLRHDQLFARADYKAFLDAPESAVPIIDDTAMELGQLYRSAALPETGADLPPARRPDQWTGQPGTRAPHLWLDTTAHRSLLDEFGRGWVLVSDDHAWELAAARATAELGVSAAFTHIDAATAPDAAAQFRIAYGLGPGGAALIRPDGYVAWRARTPPTSRTAALTAALQTAAMGFSPLSRRLRRLEDIQAITDLTARYADATNQWNGKKLTLDAIPHLFVADASVEIPGSPATHGAAAIATELPAATAAVSFAMHTFLNPAITIDGDAATGTWLMWVASIIDNDRGAAYLSADLTYTRTPAGWRIQTVSIRDGMRLSAR
ncbi:2,4-dichlorophenol 6-monooxygenase [Mycobacterium eburneum]|nr:FAD-dependent oxidoreductase [Mycobacterium eburneum]TDH55031.1 2,4-dichlorophenol 6-monooxygenase [Mycobacterium eburneum]